MFDRASAVVLDNDGNIYLTGTFYGVATFDTTHVISRGAEDVFIAKYLPDGHLDWIFTGGGQLNDGVSGITIDPSKNVTITGHFISTATYAGATITSYVDPVTSNPSTDVFILQIDSNGVFRWLKSGGSIYSDKGIGIVSDNSGNIYVTGNYSDTATFDVTHPNTTYNAIFLMKCDVNGNEQWFRTLGGSTYNTVSDIAMDNNSNLLLCGNFAGTLRFFGTNTLLPGHYANNVYVAKYDLNGNVVWSASNGSDNFIETTDIAVDDSSNVYIGGNFKCTLTEFSGGTALFNSVGHEDVFYSKFNSAGQWKLATQYGGDWDDHCNGVSIFNHYYPILTGKYNDVIKMVVDTDFYNPLSFYHYSAQTISPGLCPDVKLTLSGMKSLGASDIFIINAAHPNLPPFYYYEDPDNPSSYCSFPQIGVCITDLINCVDTLWFCGFEPHQVHMKLYGNGLSPSFQIQWSNGSMNPVDVIDTTQILWVSAGTYDGCYVSSDTVVVICYPIDIPELTDDHGINFAEDTIRPIYICKGDSIHFNIANPGNYVTLIGSDASTNTGVVNYTFYSDTLSRRVYNIGISFTDTITGCVKSNRGKIYVDTALVPIKPWIALSNGHNDSIEVCAGGTFEVYLLDSLTNPTGQFICNSSLSQYATIGWISTPYVPTPNGVCSFNISKKFQPVSSGIYTVNCDIVRYSPCGGADTFNLSLNVYVTVNPAPTISGVITGNGTICPGDSTLLIFSGSIMTTWSAGNGGLIHGSHTNDSIYAMQPGNYRVNYYDTTQFGCRKQGTISQIVAYPSPPQIFSNPSPALICPNDSVQLTVNSTGNITWFDPYGNTFQGQTIYATIPGIYYCIQDSNGCILASNFLDVAQYGTPYLAVIPDGVLCPGKSILLQVIELNSFFNWLSPLAGFDSFQVVTSPGLYKCEVISCNIITTVQANIIGSTVSASITPAGLLQLCAFDTIRLTANPGMAQYNWNYNYNYSPVADITQSGGYYVITMDGYGCSDTSNLVAILPPPYFDPVNTAVTFCAGDSLNLFVSVQSGMNYIWNGPNNNSSSTNEFLKFPGELADTGFYILTRNDGTCTLNDSVDVTSEFVGFMISSDSILCFDTNAVIIVIPDNSAYQNFWTSPSGMNSSSPQFVIPNITTADTGIYYLTITNNNCSINESYHLIAIDCDTVVHDTTSIIPNVITPNGDGMNDFFEIDWGVSLTFKLFNRWGQLIYECNSCSKIKWDGTNGKDQVVDGTYYYLLSSAIRNHQGYIEVIK
jgi:gliding motility-associated-like protein